MLHAVVLHVSPKTKDSKKQKLLYIPQDFENGLTIDALVESEAYVSAIAQNKLDRTKIKPRQDLQNRRPSQFSEGA